MVSRLHRSLKTNARLKSLQTFPYFFYNLFISSHWPLKFDILVIKINTSIYRFLLKNFNFESNYSLPSTNYIQYKVKYP